MKKLLIPILFLGLFSCTKNECREDVLNAQIDTLKQKAKYYEIMYVNALEVGYEMELINTRRSGGPPPPPPAPIYWPPVKK